MRQYEKKLLIPSLLLILFACFSLEAADKFRLGFFTTLNGYPGSGSASEYEPGINDFPIMLSHLGIGFGLHLAARFNRFSLGLEAGINPGGKASLDDPSDNDRVRITTATSLATYLWLAHDLGGSSRLRLSLLGGIGLLNLFATHSRTYTTSLNNKVVFGPPEKLQGISLFLGPKLNWQWSKRLNFSVNIRLWYLRLAEPQVALALQTGLDFPL